MQVLDWMRLSDAERRAALARTAAAGAAEVRAEAGAIIATARSGGGAALLELTHRLSGVRLDDLVVGSAELTAAEGALSAAQRAAIERAIGQVERFHAAQRLPDLRIEVSPGIHCERVTRPLPAVGLYVPAGSAPLPSTAIMLAVPARLAGCAQRVVCTPPRRDG
ncbi:MAG: histidinol dehydrogenase, partial [Steroidobacteraceae bacterium]|nr:histidinol dehydrogenase [Steroidobacteraceae bacterium]MDW8260507.1 histidinol dehydrogenase [Gammaproteobacteria bacterium]